MRGRRLEVCSKDVKAHHDHQKAMTEEREEKKERKKDEALGTKAKQGEMSYPRRIHDFNYRRIGNRARKHSKRSGGAQRVCGLWRPPASPVGGGERRHTMKCIIVDSLKGKGGSGVPRMPVC